MQVDRHIQTNEQIFIRDLYKSPKFCHVLKIGETDDGVDLFFEDLNHLKQFSEQLNKQIKEIEK